MEVVKLVSYLHVYHFIAKSSAGLKPDLKLIITLVDESVE